MSCDPSLTDAVINVIIVIAGWEIAQAVMKPLLDRTIGRWLP